MHLIFCTLLLLIAAVIGQDISFITPGPSTTIDFSKNVIHPLGSQFHIEWTAGTDISKRISLVLFQSNGSALVYPFEYIAQNILNTTSTDWTVTTNKNLSFSEDFVLNIFYEGATAPAAVSQNFNISDPSKPETRSTTRTTSTVASSSSSATSTASTIASSSAPITSTTGSLATSIGSSTIPAAATSPSIPDAGSGLSTGGKVGIGIGIPVVVLVGVAAGYFLFKRQYKLGTHKRPVQQDSDIAKELAKSTFVTPRYEMSGNEAVASTRYEIYTPEDR